MNTTEKIRVLGGSAAHDACSCVCVPRPEAGSNRIGETLNCAVSHSAAPDGRQISLFKVLMTNVCSFDCKYCPNAVTCSTARTSFGEEELAKAFLNLYMMNYVEGLFLSSGIAGDPEKSMERMLGAVRLLRNRFMFRGYVHLKVLPGSSREQIKEAGELADRISVNLESPSSSRLSEISSQKDFRTDIIRRQRWMKRFLPASGHSTQFVVGGADESDMEILNRANWEYQNLSLSKAYYSGFRPLKGTALESRAPAPHERELALYRADFLIRSYSYDLSLLEAISDNGFLPRKDPKFMIALNLFDSPADINELGYRDLLKIPGIGHRSASRITNLQRKGVKIKKRVQLKSMGVVLSRAEPFLKLSGHSQARLGDFA